MVVVVAVVITGLKHFFSVIEAMAMKDGQKKCARVHACAPMYWCACMRGRARVRVRVSARACARARVCACMRARVRGLPHGSPSARLHPLPLKQQGTGSTIPPLLRPFWRDSGRACWRAPVCVVTSCCIIQALGLMLRVSRLSSAIPQASPRILYNM